MELIVEQIRKEKELCEKLVLRLDQLIDDGIITAGKRKELEAERNEHKGKAQAYDNVLIYLTTFEKHGLFLDARELFIILLALKEYDTVFSKQLETGQRILQDLTNKAEYSHEPEALQDALSFAKDFNGSIQTKKELLQLSAKITEKLTQLGVLS